MENKKFEIGPIRPPSEANSLLLRVTENCTWNKCKFCMLYKGEQFHTRPVEELKRDVDVIADYRDRLLSHKKNGEYDLDAINKEFASLTSYEARMSYQMVFTWLTEGDSQAIFLQDANTMVLRPEWLIEIISYISEKLPELTRITSYGRADTLAKISLDDMVAMRKAGLNRIHSGYESGSDRVLELISKGSTQRDEIVGGKVVKDAGIELSIYFMPGVGGRELSDENAVETAKVINEVNPDFVRLRTFVLRTGSPMEELLKTGEYTECTDVEKVLEIRNMLTHIDSKRVDGKLASDHIINLLQDVTGYLDKDIPKMVSYIDEFLNLPKVEQKKYQLARRMGFPMDWNHLSLMQGEELDRVTNLAKTVEDEEWESLLHQFLDRYI